MVRQEVINELYRLYRLQQEGLNVQNLINEMENKLCGELECCCDKLTFVGHIFHDDTFFYQYQCDDCKEIKEVKVT